MSIPNAYCKEHDEIEPQDHDIQIDGLWVCPRCSKKRAKLINGMKPLDYALQQIEKKLLTQRSK
jgi:Zn finger protein HypA/HybF involved in hydrogenase expression